MKKACCQKQYLLVIIGFLLIFIFSSCGDVANPTEDVVKYDPIPNYQNPQYIPPDVYEVAKTPWPGNFEEPKFKAIQGWFQAVTIDPNQPADSSGLVEIDYAVLIAVNRVSGQEHVVGRQDYNDQWLRILYTNEGGLYHRSFNSWYDGNVSDTMTNTLVTDGCLKIWVSLFPNKVSHWWLSTQFKYPRDTEHYYYVRCKMRISGNVGLQIAGDYYTATTADVPNNLECFHSGWYGPTNGQFITVRYPENFD